MSAKLKAIRGMRDVLPAETPIWQWLENKFRRLTYRYGYRRSAYPCWNRSPYSNVLLAKPQISLPKKCTTLRIKAANRLRCGPRDQRLYACGTGK